MDLAIADRYEIPLELVWFNRKAYEEDLLGEEASAEEMPADQQTDEKKIEDMWNALLTELDLQQREGMSSLTFIIIYWKWQMLHKYNQ